MLSSPGTTNPGEKKDDMTTINACGNQIVTPLGVEDCGEKATSSRVVDALVTNLCKGCTKDHDRRDHRHDRPAGRPA